MVKTKKKKPVRIWKKKSVFWKLEYWKYLDVRHCIDVMHVEKNVCDSILGMLLSIQGKTKDGVNAKLDMEKLRPKLAAKQKKDGKWEYLSACYNLSKEEILEVLEFLFTIKTPSWYSANIKCLVDMPAKKISGMKSHDCHVMLTQILPVAIRNVLPKPVREPLMRLCSFFNTIS